jgi:phage portal protein BeeE
MEFYQGTMQPYVVRWEAEIKRKLMREDEKPRLSVKFNLDARLTTEARLRPAERYQRIICRRSPAATITGRT